MHEFINSDYNGSWLCAKCEIEFIPKPKQEKTEPGPRWPHDFVVDINGFHHCRKCGCRMTTPHEPKFCDERLLKQPESGGRGLGCSAAGASGTTSARAGEDSTQPKIIGKFMCYDLDTICRDIAHLEERIIGLETERTEWRKGLLDFEEWKLTHPHWNMDRLQKIEDLRKRFLP